MTIDPRDELIRAALTPAPNVHAPHDLADGIYRAILTTPQRHGLFALPGGRRFGTMPTPLKVVILVALLVILAVAVAVGARELLRQRAVSMYHGSAARTGEMPGPDPVGVPVIAWEHALGGAVSETTAPVVADGNVYIADQSGAVTALDEDTGGQLWASVVPASINASPALVAGLVVVGSDDGRVTAFDVRTGAERWHFTAGGPVRASMTADERTIYAGSDDGRLYALASETGREQWSVDIGGALTRGPAIGGDVLFVGGANGRFMAIDARTRAARWSRELGLGEPSTPAVAAGTVYVAHEPTGGTPGLTALAVSDGSARWTFASPESLPVFVGAVDRERIYVVSEDHHVYALGVESGAPRWRFRTDGIVGALAAIVEDVLYVASDDQMVYALDAVSGTLRWSLPVTGSPSSPAVINGQVIVGTDLGKVVAIGGTQDPP